MPRAQQLLIAFALITIAVQGTWAATTEEKHDKQIDLLEKTLNGGRRALLNVGGRDKFIKQSFLEAIENAIREHESEDFMGRRLLQISNPIAVCGLTQLVVQAQAAGVSIDAIATLFLEILLIDYAGTPSGGLGGFGSPVSQQQLCNLVRLRLTALIQARLG